MTPPRWPATAGRQSPRRRSRPWRTWRWSQRLDVAAGGRSRAAQHRGAAGWWPRRAKPVGARVGDPHRVAGSTHHRPDPGHRHRLAGSSNLQHFPCPVGWAAPGEIGDQDLADVDGQWQRVTPPPLLRTITSPRRESMSPSSMAATSPDAQTEADQHSHHRQVASHDHGCGIAAGQQSFAGAPPAGGRPAGCSSHGHAPATGSPGPTACQSGRTEVEPAQQRPDPGHERCSPSGHDAPSATATTKSGHVPRRQRAPIRLTSSPHAASDEQPCVPRVRRGS